GVAVEILVEQDQGAPVRVVGPARVIAVAGPASALVGQKNRGQAARQFAGNFMERQRISGAGRALDLEAVAVEVVVAFERLDEEIIDGKPDRSAPVRVAAEEPGARFARSVFHAMRLAAGLNFERMFLVKLRQGTNPVRREEVL